MSKIRFNNKNLTTKHKNQRLKILNNLKKNSPNGKLNQRSLEQF